MLWRAVSPRIQSTLPLMPDPFPGPLRRHAHGVARIAFAVALLTGCAMLFAGHLSERAPRWQRELWNLGHIGLFAGLAMALWPRLAGALWLRFAALTAGGAAVGLAVEVIQRRIGRDFSLHDVLLDVIGVWLGALLAAHGELPRRVRTALWLPLLTLLSATVVPFTTLAWDALQARRQFPLLAGFDSPLERQRLHLYGGTTGEIEGGALRLRFGRDRYAGFIFDQMPRDWRGYRALWIEVDNPEATPLALTCRINDGRHFANGSPKHDRYNRRFELAPGGGVLRIDLAEVADAPRGRVMAMDDIAEFGCFTVRLQRSRALVLLAVGLEE
jgi:VanZ family protein